VKPGPSTRRLRSRQALRRTGPSARPRTGKVYLVGSGPGDPDLLTLKAKRLLEQADVIVHDRLVDARVLAMARPDAEMVDMGKERGTGGQGPQAAINARLVSEARKGRMVVRLKGGDPFVFGRGGEEALALAYANVPFEVVPGVTSAIAVPAYAGIPVTHRGLAAHVTVVTGSQDPSHESGPVDWAGLAKADGTLVVLMGRESLPDIAKALVEGGRPAGTPVALVRWGTLPHQRTVTGTLADIADAADEAKLEPPVVAVIGEVVRLRETLDWYESQPLFGKRVLVTRTRPQAGALSAMLAERGAMPIEVPAIDVIPAPAKELDKALRHAGECDWVTFSSANGVDAVFARLAAMGRDARALGGVRVAAIGPGTAERLRTHGIVANFVPDEFVSESLAEGLGRLDVKSKRVLVVRSDIGREVLPERLAALGADVQEVVAYRTAAPDGVRERLAESLAGGMDVATFTSSSTVKNLVGLLDGGAKALRGVDIACIGPVTAQAAGEAGLKVAIVATEYTVPGLVRALEEHYSRKKGGR